jgi:hypothetical protein
MLKEASALRSLPPHSDNTGRITIGGFPTIRVGNNNLKKKGAEAKNYNVADADFHTLAAV